MALPTQNIQYRLDGMELVHREVPNEYVLKVRDLPKAQKPREKLLSIGPSEMNLSELIAILWGVGTRKEEVLAMAERITREYGGKALAATDSPEQLADATGIPLTKACQIVAGFELGKRFYAHQYGRPVFIRSASQAYEYLKNMADSHKEQLRGLYLNSRYRLIHDELISVGTLTANIVHPREIFKPAIEHGAVALIIAHNHPSRNASPTEDDIEITTQLVAAGKLIGIEVLDHLVIGDGHFRSILEQREF